MVADSDFDVPTITDVPILPSFENLPSLMISIFSVETKEGKQEQEYKNKIKNENENENENEKKE